MTLLKKNELDGWRKASLQEQKMIGETMCHRYKRSASSKLFWGIVMMAVAIFLVCGIIVQALDATFGVAALIFFAILALLALISGILLGLRAGADKKLENQISQGIYEVMDCMCIQTDHRVDGHAVSLIRIRTSSGQECADWFRAPRSLARRFDALAMRTATPVPDFPLLLVRFDGWREYYVFQV